MMVVKHVANKHVYKTFEVVIYINMFLGGNTSGLYMLLSIHVHGMFMSFWA